MMTLQQAMQWLPDAVPVGDPQTIIMRVHTDTRSLQPGDLFVALKGERYDANAFLADARAQGAVAAIAHGGLQAAGLPGLEVADTRLALAALAKGWRAQFNMPLVAVTGSNGKTTLTQMIAAIFRAWMPDATLATQGNFNNEIGVPLTLLRLRASHKLAVVELGMNHPGEIAQLADIARPTIAVVNNAQREHQEFMATVEAVARENGAVLQALAANGVAIFPADDPYAPLWRELAGRRPALTFALQGETDVTGSAVWDDAAWQVSTTTVAGPLWYQLQLAGTHNVKNSLAAVACALAAGVPREAIARGLSTFEPVKGRSRAFRADIGERRITVVDDTYNANPDSVRAAIDVLAGLPGPRLLVLGDMGEVGDQGPHFHAEVGAYARERGIEQMFGLGAMTAQAIEAFGGGRHFADMESLVPAVLHDLHGRQSVLVKGSRFMKMERVVEAITQQSDTHREQAHAA